MACPWWEARTRILEHSQQGVDIAAGPAVGLSNASSAEDCSGRNHLLIAVLSGHATLLRNGLLGITLGASP